MRSVIYLNRHAAVGKRLGSLPLSSDYRAACRFFGAPLIDRTGLLKTGFRYEILSPIPEGPQVNNQQNIADICKARATEVIELAKKRGCRVQVLWSGGIDSTAALIAIIRALQSSGELHLLTVTLTRQSIAEYPLFFDNWLRDIRYDLFDGPVMSRIRPDHLIVTGEHGDQLFGSVLAEHALATGEARRGWREAFPKMLARSLGSETEARRVLDYLAPQIARSPRSIETVFHLLWWLNFSLKWQNVQLRMVAFYSGNRRLLFDKLVHFFSSVEFQNWALHSEQWSPPDSWSDYKQPLKEYIFRETGDRDYLENKTKVPSLKNVLRNGRFKNLRLKTVMFDTFNVRTRYFVQINGGMGIKKVALSSVLDDVGEAV